MAAASPFRQSSPCFITHAVWGTGATGNRQVYESAPLETAVFALSMKVFMLVSPRKLLRASEQNTELSPARSDGSPHFPFRSCLPTSAFSQHGAAAPPGGVAPHDGVLPAAGGICIAHNGWFVLFFWRSTVQFFFQDLSSLTVSLLSFQARLQRGPMLSRHSPWETHLELLFHPSRTSLLGPSGCPSLLLFPTALLDWNISRRYLHPSSFPGEWVVTWEAACIWEKARKHICLYCSCMSCCFWAAVWGLL